MSTHAPKIRNLVGGLGLVIALVVAVAAPLGYFVQGYFHVAEELAFKSQLNASRVAKYIYANESVWRFQPTKISDLIEVAEQGTAQVHQRILAANGRPVLEDERTLAAPVERVRQPIMVRGETVAWLEAETSLRPLLTATAGVGTASGLLGLLAWLTVRLLPLRVLDDTLARLSMQGARFEAQSVRFQAALDNMTQGLCLFDAEGRLIVHNQRFAAMFGAPLTGAHASTLMAVTRVGDTSGLPDLTRSSGPDSYVHDLPDGRVIQVSRQAIPGQGWVATYEDITERRRSQDQLSHMARHDALTGLPNRVKFREHIEETLSRARRDGGVAVLYLDLDGFKGVNDTLGHAVGDQLLRAVAARLRECTRDTDLVARLGGDEFIIVQADVQQPVEATTLSERLVRAMQKPFECGSQRVVIGTSIGIALADATATADDLLRNADIALYRAKASGRGAWQFFEAQMDVELLARRTLEADLRRALIEGQFEVFYQPLIDARTEGLTGFEALLRWKHPERGLISPAEFIPLAEENGLIQAMGAWVLTKACADAAGWPEHVKVAVNLSTVQFARGNLVCEVEQALAASGLAPGRLELEITESVLLQDDDATLTVLHRLRGMGVRIAMDDFGTGYSSLSYLRRFPFDKIKIDQSFVRSFGAEKGSVGIIRAVIGLGRALGMEVLAEGVETADQLRMLQAEGCDELQGYLFSEPKPLRDLREIIEKYSPTRDHGGHTESRWAAPPRLILVGGQS